MAHAYRDDFPLLKSQDVAYLDNAATAQQAAKAGATVAVVGNALFTSSDAPALVRQMQAL